MKLTIDILIKQLEALQAQGLGSKEVSITLAEYYEGEANDAQKAVWRPEFDNVGFE